MAEEKNFFMKSKEMYCCTPSDTGIVARASIAIIFSTCSFSWLLAKQMAGDYSFETIHDPHDDSNTMRIPKESHGVYENVYQFSALLLMSMNVLDVILRSYLIFGVVLNKPSLMFPSICMDLTTIYSLIAVVYGIFATTSLSWDVMSALALQYLVMICLTYHFFLVNYSYYEELCYTIYGHMANSGQHNGIRNMASSPPSIFIINDLKSEEKK